MKTLKERNIDELVAERIDKFARWVWLTNNHCLLIFERAAHGAALFILYQRANNNPVPYLYTTLNYLIMTTEDTPLPAARMATINATPFWVYWIVSLFLFTYNYFSTAPDLNTGLKSPAGHYIVIGIFVVLFLYLAGQNIKSKESLKWFNVVCYILQSASMLFMIYQVFF
ncbi:hypothetical protein LX99_04049 [Mucilaginibacter oryzae]|uniref:Uncharacterized protein n=1 Tax=Mucilaginibacter oryzae TaxID=468058 RepID=A0A316H2Y5_9SPHI|nr:hypothetical protein [Mucilaginibacter oryzae]PWK74247.1 hypothetical protein LX99_04049 [Mucilaginibacter oryzae]